MKKGIAIAGILLLTATILVVSYALFPSVMAPPLQCRDKIDNDGDTFTDYPSDPGCSSKHDNNELGTVACDNGLDDDGDFLIDYPDDPGCVSPTDTSEVNVPNSTAG